MVCEGQRLNGVRNHFDLNHRLRHLMVYNMKSVCPHLAFETHALLNGKILPGPGITQALYRRMRRIQFLLPMLNRHIRWLDSQLTPDRPTNDI